MHHLGRRFFFFLQKFVPDAGILFAQYQYLSCQAVTSGGHFDRVRGYPVHINRSLPAAPTKAGAHRYRAQQLRRKLRGCHAGRYRLL